MRRVLLLLLIPLSFTSLAAQDALTAGDKVRVTTEEERVVGYWVSLDDNQLTLNTEARDSSLELPLASLTKLEVSQGMKSHSERGVILGVLLGLGGSIAVCAATWEQAFEFLELNPSCNLGLAAFVFFGSITLGATIGAVKTESWQDVPLDRIRVSLTPRGGGLEVSARFVF